MKRLARTAALASLVVSMAACGSSSKSPPDAHGQQMDSCCGDDGHAPHHGKIHVVLVYAGATPLHDISVHLTHGSGGCDGFDPEDPWTSEGLGWETAASPSDDVLWEGLQSGQNYNVTALAPGPADSVLAWACRDSIVVPPDEEEVVEVKLELQLDEAALDAACGQLDGDACSAEEQCLSIKGWPQPEACLASKNDAGAGEAQFVSCEAFETCGNAMEWAHPADQPDEPWLFQTTCIPQAWVSADEAPCGAGCPDRHPWMALPLSYSQFDCELPAGTVCSWPAEECAVGEKPDNVCTCTAKQRFECETPFHNCLPLYGIEENPDELRWRHLPKHRPEAAPCAPVVSPRPDVTCQNSRSPSGNPDPECATDEDCGDGGLCLDSYAARSPTAKGHPAARSGTSSAGINVSPPPAAPTRTVEREDIAAHPRESAALWR